MESNEILDQLSFQRNLIQLRSVELVEVSFNNYRDDDTYSDLPFNLHRNAEIESDYVKIFLTANVGSKEESKFEMKIKYMGIVHATENIEMEELKNYALQNVIPMLLPYIREVSSSIISRTDLPIFMLPTLDVINYLTSLSNDKHE